ncbi:MAG TPA: hypothetical protein VFJ07_24030, partial [Streptosporangiaceae bacterium]|nr:hypothetical protein [Streptosporangiaceae bacterium]
GPAGPGAVGDEPAGQDTAAADTAAEQPASGEPADKNGDGGPWSPAPLASHLDRARPASHDAGTDVDPAADWERLAAGAQAAGSQAARWRAQTDADVANEWPGPPLRTAMRNGLLAGDAGPAPATDQSVDDAQTDPGLPGPRPAAEEPGRMEGGLLTPAEAGSPGPDENSVAAPPEASAAGPDENGPASPTRPDKPEPAPSARAARRGRSRRAAADVPTEPDAADEWISLLTADPVEE